ncbi:MAG: hypothetical protein ACE5RG_09915 [Candidatus Nitrosomaritimum yanchengensis]
MKTRYKIFIVIGGIAAFVVWSMLDLTCKPCIVPPDAPDNYYCASVCRLEPRWVDWFRGFSNMF